MRERIAKVIAESHGYVFPTGDKELDDSFMFWADKIIKSEKIIAQTLETHTTSNQPTKGQRA